MPDAVVQSITVTVPPLESAERITLSMPKVLGDVAQIDALLRCQTYAAQVADAVESMGNPIEVGKSYFSTSYYGAVGDGTTDDTAAIQDTIDAAAAVKGGEVVLGPGGHKVTAPLVWPAQVWPETISMRGTGPSSFLAANFVTGFTGDAIIKIAGAGVGAFQSNINLRDFYIYGFDNSYTDDPTHPVGIWIEGAAAVNVEGVTVTGVNNHGVLLRGVWDIYLSRLYVASCGRRSSGGTSYAALQIDSSGKVGLGTTNTVYLNGVDVEAYRGIGMKCDLISWLHGVNCKFHGNASAVPWATLAYENIVLSDVYGGSLSNLQVRGNDTSVLGANAGVITFAGTHNSVALTNAMIWANAADRPILVKSTVNDGAIILDNIHFGVNTACDAYVKVETGAGWVVNAGRLTREPDATAALLNDGRLGSAPIETAAW